MGYMGFKWVSFAIKIALIFLGLSILRFLGRRIFLGVFLLCWGSLLPCRRILLRLLSLSFTFSLLALALLIPSLVLLHLLVSFFVLGPLFFLLAAVVVHAVAAHQVQRPLSLHDLDGGGEGGDQEVHVLLDVGPALHGDDRQGHLLLVVTLAFNLDDCDLVLLSLGHQDGSLDEQPVAGLHAFVVLGLLRVPNMLLVGCSEGARPKELLLDIVTSEDSGHVDLEDTVIVESLKEGYQ